MKRRTDNLKFLFFPLLMLLLGAQTLFAQSYSPVWKENRQITITGNSLQKNHASNSWNSGAISTNTLFASQNGWVEHTVSSDVDNKIFGFKSTPVQFAHQYSTYNYSFYLREGGILEAMEEGTSHALGSYALNDKLRMERSGSTIYYKQNGTTIRTVTVDATEELQIVVAIHTENGIFDNLICSFDQKQLLPGFGLTKVRHDGTTGQINATPTGGYSPYSYAWEGSSSVTSLQENLHPGNYSITITDNQANTATHNVGLGYPVRWTGHVGAQTSGDDLERTAPSSGWSCGAYSENKLPANTDGWMEFTITNPSEIKFIALTTLPISDASQWQGLKYALFPDQVHQTRLYQSGIIKTYLCTYQEGDVLRIERKGSKIFYKLNGISYWYSHVDPSEELVAAGTIYNAAEKLVGVRTSFNVPLDVDITITEQTPSNQGSVSLNIEGGATPYTILWNDGESLLSEGAYDTLIGYLDTIDFDSTGLIAPKFTETTFLNYLAAHSQQDKTNLGGSLFKLQVSDQLGTTFTEDLYVPAELNVSAISGGTYINKEVTKTVQDGWGNMSLTIDNTIPSNTDSWFSFSVPQDDAIIAVGLIPTTTTGLGYLDMLYSFRLENTTVKIWEDGAFAPETATLTAGDVFRIERVGSDINYVHNGSILRTTVTDASKAYKPGIEISSQLGVVGEPNTPEPYWIIPIVTLDHARCGFESGSIELDLNEAPDPPFNFLWSNGSTLEDQHGLSPGTYTLTITNSVNFTQTYTYEIANKVRWADLQNTTTGSPDDHTLIKNNGGFVLNAHGVSENETPSFVVNQQQWAEFSMADNTNSPVSITQFGLKKSNSALTNTTAIPGQFLLVNIGNGEFDMWVWTNGWWYVNDEAVETDRLRVQYDLNTTEITYYKNGTLIPSPFYSPTIGDQLKVAGQLFSEQDKILYATTNIGCKSISQYGELKKTVDAGYYRIMDGKVRFKYREKYNDSDGQLSFKIYDEFHKDVTNVVTYSALNPQTLVYGENWFDIDIALLNAGNYILEVVNEKNEKNYLRFKI